MIVCLCFLLLAGCGKKGNPTMKSFEKPAPVTQILAVHRDGKVIISWSYPKQGKITVKGFYIERAEGLSPFENVGFVKGDVTSYTDESFTAGKEYIYKIRVKSTRDILSDDSAELDVNPVKMPEPPKRLAYRLTDDEIKIEWDAIPNATYNIYRSAEKGKYSGAPLNAVPLDKPFFTDQIVTAKPVFYAVRLEVRSNIRNEGELSAELEVDPRTFVPVRPVDLRYVRSEGKGYLSWKGNAEAWITGYRVYRKTAPAEYLPVAVVAVPVYVDETPVTAPTAYYVTTLGPASESAPSETMSVNP